MAAHPGGGAGDGGLIEFLRGTGRDSRGRRLEEILGWDDDELEYVHDWVQWVFPTDEQSAFNGFAPLLTLELSEVCIKDSVIRSNMQGSFKRFLQFLGLEMLGDEVQKAANFKRRAGICWTSMGGFGNHNWLRISRVLHCLGMVGLLEEQQAFMQCLERLCKDKDVQENDRRGMQRSLPHWQGRAKTVPVETASAGAVNGAADT